MNTLITRPLAEYLQACLINDCRWCGSALAQRVDTYDHADGWLVRGFDCPQWLSRHCPKCGYDWSLQKLGVPRA